MQHGKSGKNTIELIPGIAVLAVVKVAAQLYHTKQRPHAGNLLPPALEPTFDSQQVNRSLGIGQDLPSMSEQSC